MTPVQAVQAKAIELGKLAIRATTSAGAGHPTTALSLAHLVTVLMYRRHALGSRRTRCAGVGSAGAVGRPCGADRLCRLRGPWRDHPPGGQSRPMTMDDLMALRSIDSPIDGHPNPVLGFPFFDAATGSLGQGLSVAAGLAAAARLDGIGKTIYCIIGDGESREGQIWEAMDFVAEQQLSGVVAIFNCNTLGQSDPVAAGQDWQHLSRKAEAFGWNAVAIDGHDPAAIEELLAHRPEPGIGKPLCVIARTVKGWGVPALGGMGHHGTPVAKDKIGCGAGRTRQARAGRRRGGAGRRPGPRRVQRSLRRRRSRRRRRPGSRWGSWPRSAATRSLQPAVKEKHALSPRRAYGLALKAAGRRRCARGGARCRCEEFHLRAGSREGASRSATSRRTSPSRT